MHYQFQQYGQFYSTRDHKIELVPTAGGWYVNWRHDRAAERELREAGLHPRIIYPSKQAGLRTIADAVANTQFHFDPHVAIRLEWLTTVDNIQYRICRSEAYSFKHESQWTPDVKHGWSIRYHEPQKNWYALEHTPLGPQLFPTRVAAVDAATA